MAEEKVEVRELTWRRLMPWTELFRGFQVALDPNKLLLAAAGIAVMAFGWWFLALVFAAAESSTPPDWPGQWVSQANDNQTQGWVTFRQARQHWNLMHEAIGLTRDPQVYQVQDIAETFEEYQLFEKLTPGPNVSERALELIAARFAKPAEAEQARIYRERAAAYAALGRGKPAGRLAVSPWAEDRGPNPYLLLTGQVGIPWEANHFWEWFTRDQAPVMIEPLVKLVRPIIYYLSPRNDFVSRLYFLLVTLFTLATWSFFGGAITRIAVVQVTRGERIGVIEAVRFTLRRFLSYIVAPLFPLGLVFVLMVVLGAFGLLHMIPVVGDILVDGLLWPIPLLLGLVMAGALVGLVGWPLMATTVSAEGTDSWEAVSRTYSYVFQRPWYYAWYGLVAIAYGGVLVFFVGFMGSLSVYLAKWGVNQAPLIQTLNRENSFLFVYAPTSFGWRELLLEGARVRLNEEQAKDPLLANLNGASVVTGRSEGASSAGQVGGLSRYSRINTAAYDAYLKTLSPWNRAGATLVAFWLGLAFLLVLGFGYSYFWTASTIIYLLLRKSVDSAELDEVYMEEDDFDATVPASPAPTAPPAASTPAPARPATTLPVVEAPAAPVVPAPVPVPPAAPAAAPAPVVTPPAVKAPEPPLAATPPSIPVSDPVKGPPKDPVDPDDL